MRARYLFAIFLFLSLPLGVQATSIAIRECDWTVKSLSGEYGICSYGIYSYGSTSFFLVLGPVTLPVPFGVSLIPSVLLIALITCVLAVLVGYLIHLIRQRHRLPTSRESLDKALSKQRNRLGVTLRRIGACAAIILLVCAALDILGGLSVSMVQRLRADKAIHIEINSSGLLKIGGAILSRSTAELVLRRVAQTQTGATNYPVVCHVSATNATAILAVVDSCRELGYRRVVIVFEPAPNYGVIAIQ